MEDIRNFLRNKLHHLNLEHEHLTHKIETVNDASNFLVKTLLEIDQIIEKRDKSATLNSASIMNEDWDEELSSVCTKNVVIDSKNCQGQ